MISALAELKRSKEDLIAAFSEGSVSTDFPEHHTEISVAASRKAMRGKPSLKTADPLPSWPWADTGEGSSVCIRILTF
jgi:hypothetical protein